MRWVLMAVMAAGLMASSARAEVIAVTFEVGGNWMQVSGVEPPYGLPSDPFLTGSFEIDSDTAVGGISPGSAIQNLVLQVGSRLFTEADLTFDSLVAWSGGKFLFFQINFGGNNIVAQTSARFYDGVGDLACNDCVTVTSPAPIPEPSTWAMMIAGLGLAGLGLRRRCAIPAVS